MWINEDPEWELARQRRNIGRLCLFAAAACLIVLVADLSQGMRGWGIAAALCFIVNVFCAGVNYGWWRPKE